ncbi:MAG: sulfite exporter TauE/SafE family protein [Candidatus Wukongarchaeota archaeon]|nr:sulfite exporter TauE/SafE family protein [Candidatus Wukongarchaeota archaeon]
MEPIYIIALIITGIAVGFFGGMLGVGGCFIMVPVMIAVYPAAYPSASTDTIVRLAFGTNLLVVFPTAMMGAYNHDKKGAVWWRAGLYIGAFTAIGVVVGAILAAHTPGATLKAIFGAAVLIGAVRMITAKPPKVGEEPIKDLRIWLAVGVPMGVVIGLIGIGGGLLMVPLMAIILHFKIHNAVGTSTAIMMITSIIGAIAYALNGLNVSDLPEYSIGYVNLLAWICLAATSVPMAIVGVKAAHKTKPKELKNIFAVVLFYVGLKMIGVFKVLGLPL